MAITQAITTSLLKGFHDFRASGGYVLVSVDPVLSGSTAVCDFVVGPVSAADGGHPPEFWAERIVDRLIKVGDTAPEPIRAHMLTVVLEGINRAIQSDRAYRK